MEGAPEASIPGRGRCWFCCTDTKHNVPTTSTCLSGRGQGRAGGSLQKGGNHHSSSYYLGEIEDDCPRESRDGQTPLVEGLTPGKQSPHGAKTFAYIVQTAIWSSKILKTAAWMALSPNLEGFGLHFFRGPGPGKNAFQHSQGTAASPLTPVCCRQVRAGGR